MDGTFKVTIDLENAAFEDGWADEAARILERVARRLRTGDESGKCMDANGNSVGEFSRE